MVNKLKPLFCTRHFLFLIGLIAVLLGCAQFKKQAGFEQGTLVVYLNSKTTPTSLNFTLEEIWIEDALGTKTVLPIQQKEINTSLPSQIILARGELKTGVYTKICFKISRAVLLKRGEIYPLRLLNQGVVSIPITLRIFPHKTNNLFLNWAPETSIKAETFSPDIKAQKGKTGLKKLLLYVSNSGEDYLSVIDRGSHQVIDAITVGSAPKGMTLSKDGNYLYVANYLSNSISIIETMTNRLMDTIALNIGFGPNELTIPPFSRILYVTATDSNAVIAIDTLTKSILKKIEVGQRPIGIASSADGQYVYVANTYSNNISVIETYNNKVVNTIGVGGEPKYISIYQRYIVVSNSQSNNLMFIDSHSLKVVSTAFVPSQPGRIIPGLRGWVYVAGQRSNDISFVTPMLNIAPRKLSVGKHPSGMTLDKDRKLLYVANLRDNTVSVLDLIKEEEIDKIEVGDKPYDLVLVGD
ncbi:MAG TPA: hypothetical protein ENI35_02680 [Candidatus Desulfofervidus auxilii]|uniref:YNCE-like beta-propeller domain-containing protein n=1 Tax=Desulfofervidus auxilii TaxID=1621989 RepID=A0A7C1ZN91_DESA2|nr:hypothetical protein [Candidatus Desulfofervidus auxilii]